MNSPEQDADPAAGASRPPADDLGAAVRDVARQLTHDLSDTPQDVRDAAAFAPLAIIKLAQRWANAIPARATRPLLVIGGLAAIALTAALLRRRRR